MHHDAGHDLYPSVDELLAPTAFRDYLGRPVVAVRVRPLRSDGGVSGSALSAVEAIDGQGKVSRYVLKRTSPQWDWIMRATDDACGREVAVWRTGLLDRLPAALGHAVVAAARDGAGWALPGARHTLGKNHTGGVELIWEVSPTGLFFGALPGAVMLLSARQASRWREQRLIERGVRDPLPRPRHRRSVEYRGRYRYRTARRTDQWRRV